MTDAALDLDPSWTKQPPIPPANTPSTAPAYGESQPVIAPAQPANATAPQPAGPGTPGASGGSTAKLRAVVVVSGSPTTATITVSTP